jgi:hypothetical protein
VPTEVVKAHGEIDPNTEMERLAKAGVRAIPRFQPGYPERLREIDDSPPVIYVRGHWRDEDEWSVAVVGTRRATAYGRQAAGELTRARRTASRLSPAWHAASMASPTAPRLRRTDEPSPGSRTDSTRFTPRNTRGSRRRSLSAGH